jgi:hypothetical protein
MKPLVNLTQFLLLWAVVFAAGFALRPYGVVVALLLVVLYWALVIRGSHARSLITAEKIRSTLMANEKKAAEAIQLRVCSLLARRLSFAVTSSRVILIKRRLFGGFTMRDYQWKDLHDATLSENMFPGLFGSVISFAVRREDATVGDRLTIDGIDRDVAARVYSISQEQEQAWEEKRRVRHMEEVRASSGGITMSAYPSNTSSGGAPVSALEELERAKKLLDSAVISDAEFNEIKAKILSRQAF